MGKELLIIIILIGVNAFFAGAEISIISLKKLNMEKRALEGDKKAEQILEVLNEPSKFLSTLQVGVTLAGFFTSASAAVGLSRTLETSLRNSNVAMISRYSGSIAFFLVTVVISFLSLLFGELVPKRLALKNAEQIAEKSIGIIRVIDAIAKPIVSALTYLTNFFVKLISKDEESDDEAITEEEIRMMINVGEEKGIFKKTETDMINSIFEFDDTTVADVMTPRPDIVALNVNSEYDEVVKVIVTEKYSRIPVYKDNIDEIVGILYVKEMIEFMARNSHEKFHMMNFVKEPFFVTEYLKIDVLLKEMQKNSVHIGIVIDEYGTTAGIVTIEDAIEEIVGNIFDEYDEREEEIEVRSSNEFEVDGGISMMELNDLVHAEFDDRYDTVSGLLLDNFGRFPQAGESIVLDCIKFTVLEVEGRRILRILLQKLQ